MATLPQFDCTGTEDLELWANNIPVSPAVCDTAFSLPGRPISAGQVCLPLNAASILDAEAIVTGTLGNTTVGGKVIALTFHAQACSTVMIN